MSEPMPINPHTMAMDKTVATFERMLLESYIEAVQYEVPEEHVAVRGIGIAYEMALHHRYPDKVKRP